MKILIALLIFSVLVLFHEFGHFLLAKLNGIVVTEFSLGMGPRLLSTVWHGTRYSLKMLPLGGSCAMLGEDMDDDGPGTFHAASVWRRISVVAAGPLFNFILALLFALIVVALSGYDLARVAEVPEDSHAYEAGLREGDIITSFNGYDIDLARDLLVYLNLYGLDAESTIDMTVQRDGEKLSLSFEPEVEEHYLLGFNRSDRNSMRVESVIPGFSLEENGVQAGDTIVSVGGTRCENGADYDEYLKDHPLDGTPVEVIYVRDGLEYEITVTPKSSPSVSGGFSYSGTFDTAEGLSIVKYALAEMRYMVRATVAGLKELITGHVGLDNLTGPVGIVNTISETYEEAKPEGFSVVLANMLSIAILLSVNLGIMNLLPLPALDGGRLVFLFVEAIRRKPIDRSLEGSIHLAGFMLLMLLMVFVMYQDILRIL